LLLFADNCLLFCKAHQANCRILKNILDKFCSFSGQRVNYHKSVLTFSKNANTVHRQLVAGIFNINHSNSLAKYLCCPVFQKKATRTTFQGIINKATAKLEGQKVNCLSKASWMVLIQSHLESLRAHTIQCFQLLKSTTTHLQRINKDFLWKKNNTEKGLPLIAWDGMYAQIQRRDWPSKN